MGMLVLGLALFLGAHLVPMFPALRAGFVDRLGLKAYKAGFSIVAGLGLVLVVLGYASAPPGPQLFAPSALAIRLAPFVMTVSLILLASANMRTYIRHTLRHPMLIGTILWAFVHLLANGELRATLLFGGFLAWSALDLVSATRRHAGKPFRPEPRFDLMAVGGGIALALLVMGLHRPLFGQPAVPWGM